MGNLPFCRQAGIKFDFEKLPKPSLRESGCPYRDSKKYNVWPLEFVEDSCGEYGVMAVSSYPSPVIEPGKRIEVYVVKDKAKKPQASKFRASLVE